MWKIFKISRSKFIPKFHEIKHVIPVYHMVGYHREWRAIINMQEITDVNQTLDYTD